MLMQMMEDRIFSDVVMILQARQVSSWPKVLLLGPSRPTTQKSRRRCTCMSSPTGCERVVPSAMVNTEDAALKLAVDAK